MTKAERSSPAVSSCRCQAASALGPKTRSMCSAPRPSIVASSSAPAAWMTAPRGRSAGIDVEQPFELGAIGDVAGGDLQLGAEALELRPQLLRALGPLATAADQEQSAGAVRLDQVAGDEGAEAAGGRR